MSVSNLPGNWGNNPSSPPPLLPLLIFPPHRMLKHCLSSHSWKVCFAEYRWDICWLAKNKVKQETRLSSTNEALGISVGEPNFYVSTTVSPYCLEHFSYILGHTFSYGFCKNIICHDNNCVQKHCTIKMNFRDLWLAPTGTKFCSTFQYTELD